VKVRGIVYDSANHTVLNPVSIENIRTHQGCFSNAKGEFTIEAALGDYIVFTHVGYNRKVVSLKIMDKTDDLKIYMSTKTINLKSVTIKMGQTEYQKDSVKRSELYKDAFEYEQQKSVFSPVTSAYQKFSKKYKNLRKFQEQILDIEHQKFIDTRYTAELVHTLTKLEDDELAAFINQYPLDYDYARVATELEIKMWIKYNFLDYQKKGKATFTPDTLKKKK
jgi:thiol:disulfide interchange protein